jgi:hypothetical protein
MVSHHLGPHEGPTTIVDHYLAELAARLQGARRTRAAILAEIRDGLGEATAANITSGMMPTQAAAAAIQRFGTPQAVADAFAGELTIAYARRSIAAFIGTGPLVGIWWLLLLHPRPWQPSPLALIAAIPVLPLIAFAIATAVGTFATTGRLIRWLPEASPARALAATTAVASLCLAGDLTIVTVFAIRAGTTDLMLNVLAAAAITASVLRLPCSIGTIRRCVRLRRELAPADSCQT